MGGVIRGVRLAVAATLMLGALSCQQATSTSLPSFSQAPPTDPVGATPEPTLPPTQPVASPTPTRDTPAPTQATPTPTFPALTEEDGILPDRVTVFDDEYPGVANLEPNLLEALREAATDAAPEGVVFRVNSGWRSPEYQDQLLQDAIAVYGSEEEAARWVATADNSPHVSGDAVDMGLVKTRQWLSEHGAAYGLCQIYRNEPWHFELRIEALDSGCPHMFANPTQDPRMQ